MALRHFSDSLVLIRYFKRVVRHLELNYSKFADVNLLQCDHLLHFAASHHLCEGPLTRTFGRRELITGAAAISLHINFDMQVCMYIICKMHFCKIRRTAS